MKVRCIRPFGLHVPGDEAEVPDGAEVDRHHYEPVTADVGVPEAKAAAVHEAIAGLAARTAAPAAVSFPPKEM